MKLTRRDFIWPGMRSLSGGVSAARRTREEALQDPRCAVDGPFRPAHLHARKIVADNGVSGIAEAYGSPAIGVKEQILDLKPLLVGKDPLGIDAIYTHLGEGGKSLSGTRTDGSAHSLMRAASGIEMALWDLAGRLLGQSVDNPPRRKVSRLRSCLRPRSPEEHAR